MPSLDERIQVFRNMLAADPENELANFSLGRLLVEKGDVEGAEKALRKAIEINPRLSAAILALGELLVEAGRSDEAIELLGEGVRAAHAKGEFQPRDRMRELLKGLGVEIELERPGAADADAPAGGEGACGRCGLDRPRLEAPPFGGEIGRLIEERICTSCWDEWKAMSIKVINEYRLNLSTQEGKSVYDNHMREFLGL